VLIIRNGATFGVLSVLQQRSSLLIQFADLQLQQNVAFDQGQKVGICSIASVPSAFHRQHPHRAADGRLAAMSLMNVLFRRWSIVSQKSFVLSVNLRGCFVRRQNFGVAEHRPCDPNPPFVSQRSGDHRVSVIQKRRSRLLML
jgi:hypothetical protein